MSKQDDGGPAFPTVETRLGYHYDADESYSDTFSTDGMSLRDYFAAHVQADDRLVKCIRAMDDGALAVFALHPESEREEHITETGILALMPVWAALDEVGKVTARLHLEAKAIARVRYMQADAMLKARQS